MMEGKKDITIQHSGMPKGDQKMRGTAKYCRRAWEGGSSKAKEGNDCEGVDRLNDGWIATMI
jgi:hypothetical protein